MGSKQASTVRLPPRDLAVDAVLYGNLEAHYKLCLQQLAADPQLHERPELQAQLRQYEDLLAIVRHDRPASPEGAADGRGAGLPVTPGKSPTVGLVAPFVRASTAQ